VLLALGEKIEVSVSSPKVLLRNQVLNSPVEMPKCANVPVKLGMQIPSRKIADAIDLDLNGLGL
jgi:hypothetical protein